MSSEAQGVSQPTTPSRAERGVTVPDRLFLQQIKFHGGRQLKKHLRSYTTAALEEGTPFDNRSSDQKTVNQVFF
jgi:hypothetical protein